MRQLKYVSNQSPKTDVMYNVSKKSNQSVTSVDFVSAAKYFCILCSTLYVVDVEFAVSHFAFYMPPWMIPQLTCEWHCVCVYVCVVRNNGFYAVRLDGTMTSKQRTAAIEAFSDTDVNSPSVFLMSLKAGGVGINLTAACRMFLLDPVSGISSLLCPCWLVLINLL